MMKPRRYIIDSTLRDGEQMAGVCFSPEQKLKIAALLDGGGVHQIEAGVPAMGGDEKEIIAKIMERRVNSVISVWARLTPSDIQHSIDVNPDIIHVSIPVSYPHIYAKLRKNKDWVISRLYECLELVQKSGIPLTVGYEDAFRSDAAFMFTVSRILLDFGVKRIRLSDTVGVATPTLCREVINDFSVHLDDRIRLGFHAHNDLGLAVANTLEAAKSGCMYADVTAGGIGERAGNCDLAKLVHASGQIFDWGISPFAARNLVIDILGEIRLKN